MSRAKKEEQIDIEEQISRLELPDDLINKALQGSDDAGAAEAKKALAQDNGKSVLRSLRIKSKLLLEIQVMAYERSTKKKRVSVNQIVNELLELGLKQEGKI